MIHGKQLAVSISTTGWRIQTPAQNERSQILLFGEGWNSMTKAMFWEAQRLRRRSTALSTRMCKVWGLIRAFNEIHVNFRAASAYHNFDWTNSHSKVHICRSKTCFSICANIDIGIYTCQNNTYLCSYYSCFPDSHNMSSRHKFPISHSSFSSLSLSELLSIWVPGAQVIAVLSFNLELRGGHIHANFALVLSAEKKWSDFLDPVIPV